MLKGNIPACIIYFHLFTLVNPGTGWRDLFRLSAEIDSCIDENYPYDANNSHQVPNITVQQVKKAVLELKQGKKEENGLYSNHFMHGTDRLIVLITLLFNCMLIHGIAPDDLLLGTMIPLIKNSRGKQ